MAQFCRWEFKHLEVVGTKCSYPQQWTEIRHRIPQLKVETRKYSADRKDPQSVEPRRPARSSAKRESLLPIKPPKEKLVTVKVVLPKKKDEVLERNYLCSCQQERNAPAVEDVEVIEFNELLKVLLKYNEGPRKESSKGLRNLARSFQGSKILSSDEVIQVLTLLDTDSSGLKESVLLMIGQLCSSTLNVGKFLEKGLLDELINFVLLDGNNNIKKEAVVCISKVVEKTEHADLWLEVMTISGTEALFSLLTASSSLQHTVLIAIKNLGAQPKMARVLIDYGLESVILLTSCKSSHETYIGDPEIQGLVTHALTNIISHDSSTIEAFLSKYDDVINNVLDLLQYSPCLQQQDSARFLATIAFYKTGLASLISFNAVEHLLWAVTCSQCRHLREQASMALRNISANPDRAFAFLALSQVADKKVDLQNETSWDSDSSGIFSSSEMNLQRQSTSSCSWTSSNGTPTDRQAGSKAQKTVSELTSLLTLVFQSDTLWRSGSEREFLTPSNSSDLRYTRLKKPNNFMEKEMYLCSLRVLTNCLVVISNVLLILSDNVGDTSRDEVFEERRLNQVALMIQNGVLKFLSELEFLSNKLLKVNPASFHNIDPSTLPPKEVTTTLKNARTDLIFESTSKRKESCKGYPEFGFEQNEIDFVKEAVHLLSLFAEVTAPDFNPGVEDIKVLESSKSKAAKKHISFSKSAMLVKNVMKITRGAGGRKLIQRRRSSTRSLSRSLSQASLTSSMPSKAGQSTSISTDQSMTSVRSTGAQDSRETTHYVKQSLLDAKVIYCLAPWIMCGIFDIQANVLKIIRYLQHTKYASSGPSPPSQPAPKEAWASKVPPHLTSRSSTLSQRSSSSAAPARSGMNKSKYLGFTCVRHVIQHCGGYLLDSLAPPVPPSLGKTTLMVLREAVINGEIDTRLKIVKLGCFAQVIEYIRGNEDDEVLQALGIVVIRILVGNDVSLKQLFFAHGGMNLIMALHQYKEGMVKEEAALAMCTFRRGGDHTSVHRRSKTAEGRIKRRQKQAGGDIWEEVGEKWKGQDQVVKVLRKFNVRY